MLPRKHLLAFSITIFIVTVLLLGSCYESHRSSTVTHTGSSSTLGGEESFTSRSPGETTSYTLAQTTSVRGGASNITTPEAPSYRLAVKLLKEILGEARETYLDAVKENETWRLLIYEPYSSFSKALILNSTIVNDTTIVVNGVAYRYVIVRVDDGEDNIYITPQRIRVGNILVELLPRNKSLTYTGGLPYDYLVHVGNKVCKARFYFIGFVIGTKQLTVSTDRVRDNIYEASVTVLKELGNPKRCKLVWLILVREP